MANPLISKVKTYTTRFLIFGGVTFLLFYVFASNETLKSTFGAIESIFPNQGITSTLYNWKVDYFSKKTSNSSTKSQKEIENEFEVNDKQTNTSTQDKKKPNIVDDENIEIPKSSYNDQIIKHSYYTLAYVEEYEQARWVAYKMTPKNLEKNVDRKDERFEPDPKVTTGSAVHADYNGSGYDRGHLAPAGDFTGNHTMMTETFYMSNMSPQRPLCNRETWRLLEEQTRRWGEKKKEVYIISGPVFGENMPKIGRKNKISVPSAYFKIIFSEKEQKAIAFIVPNVNKKEDYKRYQVSVDEVEKQTGLDFFSLLPDDVEKKVESATSTEGWFGAKK
ncbi:MAG: DNA/RNA non-specific endonuclease [Raineya sp.]|jgi:endonuclease G|nr:DNA/RNA non-specific endonuclease [Raineya sp.]